MTPQLSSGKSFRKYAGLIGQRSLPVCNIDLLRFCMDWVVIG